jgi:hypothetical protein
MWCWYKYITNWSIVLTQIAYVSFLLKKKYRNIEFPTCGVFYFSIYYLIKNEILKNNYVSCKVNII